MLNTLTDCHPRASRTSQNETMRISILRVEVTPFGILRITHFWKATRVSMGARNIQMIRLIMRKTAMMKIKWMTVVR